MFQLLTVTRGLQSGESLPQGLVNCMMIMNFQLASLMLIVLEISFHNIRLSLVFLGHGVRIGKRLGSTAVDVSSLRLSFPRNTVG